MCSSTNPARSLLIRAERRRTRNARSCSGMALTSALRHLAALAGSSSGSALGTAGAAAPALLTSSLRALSSKEPAFGRKDVVYNLENTSDPEAEAAVKAFQREQFAAAAKGPAAGGKPEPEYELASQIERKYAAAQIVESGIQVCSGQIRALVGSIWGCSSPGGAGGPAAGVEMRQAHCSSVDRWYQCHTDQGSGSCTDIGLSSSVPSPEPASQRSRRQWRPQSGRGIPLLSTSLPCTSDAPT